jgi:hypothetical protein
LDFGLGSCGSVFLTNIGEEMNLRETSMQIQSLIFTERFVDAEPLVQQCLQQVPEDLYFLSQLDLVLNGKGKYQEAEVLRSQILEIWERDHKAKWVEAGSPIAKATWARMFVPAQSYRVIGTEYYQPEVIGSDFPITSFYKIIAQPTKREQHPRVFKLEMSKLNDEFYVLREYFQGGGQQIVQYGVEKPDFYRVVMDTKTYLDAEEQGD